MRFGAYSYTQFHNPNSTFHIRTVRIYLTGFMASGKSTVGPKVADRLGLSFLDLDDRIEEEAGQSIPSLFAEEGEEAFRQREAKALQQTTDADDLVVALGGGALVDADNRAFAKEHGWVVYLKVPPETVVERVGDAADERPLLQDEEGTPLPPDRMRARVEEMLVDRTPTYADAHVTVDATRSVAEVVDDVVAVVQACEDVLTPPGKA